MIDLPHHPIDSTMQPAVSHAANLLRHYSFELEVTIEQQMAAWLKIYPPQWILLSVVEALYQGRYKAVSVEQILQIWQRRGQPLCHFTHEFERLVRSKISPAICETLSTAIATPSSSSEAKPEPLPQPTLSYRTLLLQLPSVKAAFRLKRLTEIPSLAFPINGATELSGQSQEQVSEIRVLSTLIDSADVSAVAELTSIPLSDKCAIVSESNVFEANKPRLPGESDRDFQQFKEGVIFALSSSLANPTLHPVIRLKLSQYYRLNWQHFLES
ncbi:MAG: hypothetical protein DCF22_23235 [Leptolyngbya sp.]|nr:MAG: hypothetical protein DCF22_23235 [Leptolyngbya sp.]